MFRPLAILLLALVSAIPAKAEPQRVEFNRDIRPILSNRCYYCHGPDEADRKAGLRLDTRVGALADLGGYAAIVPGKPEESELLARVTSGDPDEVMPQPKAKKAKLTAAEIELVRLWIEQGAEYQGHWAFEPVADPPVPKAEGASNPIDAFVRRRLVEEKIKPAPTADRYTLIRRAYLDVTGLLPTPQEVIAFVTDKDPKAYEKLIDQLLASPHYGERWGRHWLDGARYADSHGYSVDGDRQMWPYRDWVIQALNDDMPFDQFTIEQIAGDLLPAPKKSQLIATAFHRNTLINQEGGSSPEQFRVEAVMDRVNTTGAVWLGLTVGCAQCHTHKFDPIPHEDYYRMLAFFNSGEDRNNNGKTIEVAEGEVFKVIRPNKPTIKGTANPRWTALKPHSYTTASKAKLVPRPGGSLLLDGRSAPKETYKVIAKNNLDKVGAVRLRILTDKSLPKNGPGTASNGNIVLTRAVVLIDGKEQKIAAAASDHAQPGYPASAVIDGNRETGWAINVGKGQKATMNANHELVLTLAQPVAAKGKDIELRLFHEKNENYNIGHFAIDTAPQPVAIDPKPVKGKVAKLMVMSDIKEPRETYILTRGDFTRPDKEHGTLKPGTLSAIAPQTGDLKNRLDLAKWLIAEDNPLTPRVTVNRIWMRYFGIGLVETEEDFGTQGSPPSHPDLLDYLARRFMEDGWSMKKLHRLILASETYKQSSATRPDLEVEDPRNVLLARQSRIRLDAEIIRDAALCASGLLTDKIGGPSVHPPQPAGIYAFTQNRKGWPTSTGPDRYRRGMYTKFYRSAPYPLFGTFDAPDFQTTCTRRARSNTPLQALNIANDPAFIEFSQALAARVIEEVPGEAKSKRSARLRIAFALATSRDPEAGELATLQNYLASVANDFATDAEATKALVNDRLRETGAPPNEAAALVAAARVIINTDNFITRE